MNNDVVLLAIETSGRSGSVAVLRADGNGNAIHCESELLDANAGSAKTLAPAIERLMHRMSLDPSDLTVISLINGPGSFTGLRVGVATAKAMAYALNIPVVEVDTLDAIALQIPRNHASVHIVLDAYRGQVFYSGYSHDHRVGEAAGYLKTAPTTILDIDALLRDVLPSQHSGDICVCGPGCSRIRKYLGEPANHAEDLLTGLSGRIHWIDGPESWPHAESVAKLALAKVLANEVCDAFHVNPKYFRGSAAEEMAAKTDRD